MRYETKDSLGVAFQACRQRVASSPAYQAMRAKAVARAVEVVVEAVGPNATAASSFLTMKALGGFTAVLMAAIEEVSGSVEGHDENLGSEFFPMTPDSELRNAARSSDLMNDVRRAVRKAVFG